MHYERDAAQRVLWVEKSTDATHSQRTTYAYDNGMPYPKSVTSAGGAITTYSNFDPPAPRRSSVAVGADGPTPIQTYSVFNADGRVKETGKANLAATRFDYAATGRITLAGRRADAKSAWLDGTSSLAPRGVQPLTTIGPRIKTVTWSNSQCDPVWKSEQPLDGSQPARVTCFNYDGEHHLLETILPEGNSIMLPGADSEWRPLAVTKGMRGIAPTGAWAAQCLKNTSDWTGAFETVSVTEYGPNGWVRCGHRAEREDHVHHRRLRPTQSRSTMPAASFAVAATIVWVAWRGKR